MLMRIRPTVPLAMNKSVDIAVLLSLTTASLELNSETILRTAVTMPT